MLHAFGEPIKVTPQVAAEAERVSYEAMALVQEPDVDSREGHAELVGNEMVITFDKSALPGGLAEWDAAEVELADGRIFDTNRIAHDEGGLAQGIFTRRN